MKGIDLRKKGKKKSPQRGTRLYKRLYNYDTTNIVSVDSRIGNTNDLTIEDLTYDFFRMLAKKTDTDFKMVVSTLKQHLRI